MLAFSQILFEEGVISLKQYGSMLVGLSFWGSFCALSLPALSDPPVGSTHPPVARLARPKQTPVVKDFGRLPLSFEPNQGQTDRHVRFLTHNLDSSLSLTPSEAIFTLLRQSPDRHRRTGTLGKVLKARQTRGKISIGTLRMQLIGADPGATTLVQQPMEGRVNYFIGNDSSKWHTDIPTFGRVGFHGVYPGIDVVYYGNQRRLEYDFVVAPHADPKQIQLHFAGAQGVQVNAAGDLVVRTKGRELTWQNPTVYQQNATGKHAIAAHFRLRRLPNGQTGVSFALGHYDTARPLVIDPVLLYASLLSSAYGGPALAVDSAGSAYITGTTLVDEFDGNILLTKLNPSGTGVAYATYFGSTALFSPPAIAVDSSGSAYITGLSGANFPVTPGAYNTKAGSSFVTKLNPAGNGLIYSTLFGGTCKSIAVDSSGNAYITGSAGSGFPTTPGAFQSLSKAPNLTNAFVTKLNATGTALIYSTYLGGSTDLSSNLYYSDAGRSIAIDSSGNAYVTGSTDSTDFPTTPGAFLRVNPAGAGEGAAFVTKLNPTGTALIYSSFLGGNHETMGNGIAVDTSGSAYVAGHTLADDFSTTPGAFQTTNPGGSKGFVTKFNPTGTALVYSTYLYGTGSRVQGTGDEVNGVAVDSGGHAYVTGLAASFYFPTTTGAFIRTKVSPYGFNTYNYATAFMAKLNTSGTTLNYGTLIGGRIASPYYAPSDIGISIAIDSSGNAYVAGNTSSNNFPVTPGAFQTPGGGTFVTKLSPIPVYPDFNNDGFTDLILQNSSTNAIAFWLMQGARRIDVVSFPVTPPAEYALVGMGDFSANGANTMVLQSRSTNRLALWYSAGGGNFVSVTPDPAWRVVGVGDFNGDGKSDLVFQNQTTGQVAFWFMDGSVVTGGVLLPSLPDRGWNVVGVGDCNGDGFPDLVFQNAITGQIALWYMNGTTHVGGALLTSLPAGGWKVVAVGDYNGDGSVDLVFQNPTTSQAVVWYLQGGAHVGGEALSFPVPSGWKIVGPH
ncbi:MAG: hypothetical protein JWL77_5864 [Chthonomonadaceae bacterium]|nr:hypothetical protein [Chthonomonadaceae bacterium]